jgi:hypothetical protein
MHTISSKIDTDADSEPKLSIPFTPLRLAVSWTYSPTCQYLFSLSSIRFIAQTERPCVRCSNRRCSPLACGVVAGNLQNPSMGELSLGPRAISSRPFRREILSMGSVPPPLASIWRWSPPGAELPVGQGRAAALP